MGMSLTMGPIARPSAETSEALRVQADFACRLGAREGAEALADLAVRGEVVCEIVPDEEDLPMEVAEDEYDAEIDLADEDADLTEDELAEEGNLQSMPPDYELTVFRPEPGVVVCEVPEVGVGGYRGYTAMGRTVLAQLTKRQRVFQTIARWLENNPEFKQADSLVAFLKTFQPGTQKDFIEAHREEGFRKEDFSKFIQNACLVCADEGDMRLPLRRLFS